MKRLFLALVALVCVGAVSAQDVKLMGGQNIPVRLMTEINSKYRAQVAPYGIVDANIMDSKGENIVISRGTPVVMISRFSVPRALARRATSRLTAYRPPQ